MASIKHGARTARKLRVLAVLWWSVETFCLNDAVVQASNMTAPYLSTVPRNSSDPVARRLVEGLQCDLDLYNAFIESDEGRISSSWLHCASHASCTSKTLALDVDLSLAMCSDECLRSDELHKKAMSLSRCTCAQVSAETFVRHDFCLESSARLLCTHLSECGHWGCQLEDFNCLRYEWDRLYSCASFRVAMSVVVMVIAVAASWLADVECSDAACVLSGSIPSNQVGLLQPQTAQNSPDIVPNTTIFSLGSTGIQLAPELQRRVQNLLERQRVGNGKGSDPSMDVSDEAFPVAVEDLTLGSKAAELGLDGKASLYCKLQLDGVAEERQEADWLTWKLTRASEYRARGNEAFKQESYGTAMRLYKRALAWLEPPVSRLDETLDTKIEYSEEELHQVNPTAVACFANMATCYSKLDGDGDVDHCIAAASSALKLDDTHVKARYRRSQAYVASKEFDLAVADLTKLRELEPDNKLFRSAMTRAQAAKTQLRQKQQSAFANLFDK
ncbi:Peptidyl-prolyl cis-trans isomerase, FKBP-type [Phytophthora cactorum]|nr:Peptidyl-prolyl cis-trans isomerase, FKBP-type [Phytophthora cactorum]